MTPQDIDKAFRGRWHMKQATVTDLIFRAFYGDHTTVQEISSGIESLCRDFFEAALLLSHSVQPAPSCLPPSPESSVCHDVIVTPVDFDTWWHLYGKKIDRSKCEKKWKALSPSDQQACLAATPAYVASTPDIKYRRNPMTYLNNRSWENQIITSNEPAKPTLEEQRLNKLAAILTD